MDTATGASARPHGVLLEHRSPPPPALEALPRTWQAEEGATGRRKLADPTERSSWENETGEVSRRVEGRLGMAGDVGRLGLERENSSLSGGRAVGPQW